MTTPTASQPTVLRRLYAWLAAHVLDRLPSPVVELIGGILLVVLFAGTILLARRYLGAAVFFGATALNVFYALKLDPHDAGQASELPDFAIREGVVILGAALLQALRL